MPNFHSKCLANTRWLGIGKCGSCADADGHSGDVPWLQAAPDAGGLSSALDGGPEAHDRVRVHVRLTGEAH